MESTPDASRSDSCCNISCLDWPNQLKLQKMYYSVDPDIQRQYRPRTLGLHEFKCFLIRVVSDSLKSNKWFSPSVHVRVHDRDYLPSVSMFRPRDLELSKWTCISLHNHVF